jgi:hypothetical protein
MIAGPRRACGARAFRGVDHDMRLRMVPFVGRNGV